MASDQPEVSPEARELVERLEQAITNWGPIAKSSDRDALLAYIAGLEARAEGEPVAWMVAHGSYIELWTDRRKADAERQVASLIRAYPGEVVTMTPLYTRPTHTGEDGEDE